MISGIATPRAKMAKPSSNVPPVESTQSHRWIAFSGDSSSSNVRRCDGVTSVNGFVAAYVVVVPTESGCRGAGCVATRHGDIAPWLQQNAYRMARDKGEEYNPRQNMTFYCFLLRPDFSSSAA